MVNVDQQHDLQRKMQNKAGYVLTALAFRWVCVTIVNVEKKKFNVVSKIGTLRNQSICVSQ
jgi:hypothetical protein